LILRPHVPRDRNHISGFLIEIRASGWLPLEGDERVEQAAGAIEAEPGIAGGLIASHR